MYVTFIYKINALFIFVNNYDQPVRVGFQPDLLRSHIPYI